MNAKIKAVTALAVPALLGLSLVTATSAAATPSAIRSPTP